MDSFATLWAFMAEGIVISLIAAVMLPLIGAILVLRRNAFLGVAVPQFSAAGIALGLALLPLFPALQTEFLDHGHPPLGYLFAFAGGSAGLSLLLFSRFEHRNRESSGESRVAAGFAIAAACSMLFLEQAPAGGMLVETLQRGSVVVADIHSLTSVAAVSLVVFLALGLFGRGILLVSFDRDGAVALGHSPARYETIWTLTAGSAIGVGVMTIGPILVFGLLFLPPILARSFASSMRGYLLACVALAFVANVLAWPLSFQLDLPYGPTAVVSLAALGLVQRVISRVPGRRAR